MPEGARPLTTPSSYRVLVVDERRMLAAGLVAVLEDRPAIAEARALQDVSRLSSAVLDGWHVIVSSEACAGQVLRLVAPPTRVVVVLHQPDAAVVAGLLGRGAAGACTSYDLPEDVAVAVELVAAGEMRLPANLVLAVLDELQRLRQRADDADGVLSLLTERERHVLTGLGQGRGRSEIAKDLGLSPHTIRTHVQHLLRKLGVHSQMEAAAYARALVAALPTAPMTTQDRTVIDLHAHDERRALQSYT
jgi:DNA-binding NarL/FixJ family response regulator